MPKIIEGKLNAEGKKFAIVASRYNDFITEKLVSGALDALTRCGAKDKDIEIFKVPGAFEIPLVAKRVAADQALRCRHLPGGGDPRGDPALRLRRGREPPRASPPS